MDTKLKPHKKYDIAIIGASLTGQIAAFSLKDKFNICIIDTQLPTESKVKKGGRAIALSYRSIENLIKLGFFDNWQEFCHTFSQKNHSFSTINQINISQSNYRISANINAEEYGFNALGVCIQAQSLINFLCQKNRDFLQQNWLEGELTQSETIGNSVQLKIKNQQEIKNIQAKFVIFASGSGASANKVIKNPNHHFAIKTQTTPCFALVGQVDLKLNNIAHQRYCQNGVMALLPLAKNHAAYIWSFNQNIKEQFAFDSNDEDQNATIILENLKHFFPKITQSIKVEQIKYSGMWPIYPHYAKKVYQNQSLLLGASAISFSPIAAQGLNLTIADISQLSQFLKSDFSLESFCAYAIKVEKSHRKLRAFMNCLEFIAYGDSKIASVIPSDVLAKKLQKLTKKTSQFQLLNKGLLGVGLAMLNIPFVIEKFLHYFVGKKKHH